MSSRSDQTLTSQSPTSWSSISESKGSITSRRRNAIAGFPSPAGSLSSFRQRSFANLKHLYDDPSTAALPARVTDKSTFSQVRSDGSRSEVGDTIGSPPLKTSTKHRPPRLVLQSSNLSLIRSTTGRRAEIDRAPFRQPDESVRDMPPAYRVGETFGHPFPMLTPVSTESSPRGISTTNSMGPARPARPDVRARPPATTRSGYSSIENDTPPRRPPIRETGSHQVSSSRTTASSNAATPWPSRHSSSSTFKRAPLSWSTTDANTLAAELGQESNDVLSHSMNRFNAPPRVFHPSILETMTKEAENLRAELETLRRQYDSSIQRRDRLLANLARPDVSGHPMLFGRYIEALGEAMERCDSLVQRIWACGDRMRQIELGAEKHASGVLRVMLDKAGRPQQTHHSGSGRESEEYLRTVQMGKEPKEGQENKAGKRVEGRPSDAAEIYRCHDDVRPSEEQEYEDIRHAVFFHPHRGDAEMPSDGAKDHSRRMSTATLVSLNQLGFPLPPSRLLEGSPGSDHSMAASPTRSIPSQGDAL